MGAIPTTLITNGKDEVRVNTVNLAEWQAKGFWPVGSNPVAQKQSATNPVPVQLQPEPAPAPAPAPEPQSEPQPDSKTVDLFGVGRPAKRSKQSEADA